MQYILSVVVPAAPVVDGGAVVETVVPEDPVVAVVPVVADVGPVGVVVAVVETGKKKKTIKPGLVSLTYQG